MAVDVSSGRVKSLTRGNPSALPGSWVLMDVCGDFLLAQVSSPSDPPYLQIARFNGSWERPVNWCDIISSEEPIDVQWRWKLVAFMREGGECS